MKKTNHFWAAILMALTTQAVVCGHAEDRVTLGVFTEDPPTLICLGFAWAIEGDANRNATAAVDYRKKGADAWKQALPLMRTGGFHVGRTSDWLDHLPPSMLAGSIMDLDEDTEYEVRITVSDPDGIEGDGVQTLTTRTRAEPQAAEGGNIYHVYPPGADSSWTRNEFNNLYKAYYGGLGNLGDFNMVWERIVRPGDTILVHAGTYKANLNHYTDQTGLVPDGTYWLTAKGTKDEPIVIKAAGDGEVVFDGAGAEVLFNVMAADYHIIEGITFRNCGYAIFAGQQRVTGCRGLTVRNCRFENVRDGIYSLYSGSEDFFIADNSFIGRNARDGMTGWGSAEDKFLKSNTAITLQGRGHVVCRNAIAYFWQAYHMGTAFQGWNSGGVACDIYQNDMFMLIDDGIEVDGCVRNVRVLRNRMIDTGSPISCQPVYGGPAYFVRNVTYGARSAMKLQEAWPSGVLIYHNTMVAVNGVSRGTYTNIHFRNNLLLSPSDVPGRMSFPSEGNGASSDYNGYEGTRFKIVTIDGEAPIMDKSRNPYWPKKKYPESKAAVSYDSLRDLQANSSYEPHGLEISYNDFESLTAPKAPAWKKPSDVHRPSSVNFKLAPKGKAVDRGTALANVNDGFTGEAPDLGAHELGEPVPHYGPEGWTAEEFTQGGR